MILDKIMVEPHSNSIRNKFSTLSGSKDLPFQSEEWNEKEKSVQVKTVTGLFSKAKCKTLDSLVNLNT